ncbi:MAG: DUF2845 domain-containing protein [Gammaproteobacteria bacterium]
MRRCLWLLLGLFSTSTIADPRLRCGNDLIETGVGTSRYLVLQKCGEPTFRDGNRWFYDRGNTFLTILVFKDNGELGFSKTEFTWR